MSTQSDAWIQLICSLWKCIAYYNRLDSFVPFKRFCCFCGQYFGFSAMLFVVLSYRGEKKHSKKMVKIEFDIRVHATRLIVVVLVYSCCCCCYFLCFLHRYELTEKALWPISYCIDNSSCTSLILIFLSKRCKHTHTIPYTYMGTRAKR